MQRSRNRNLFPRLNLRSIKDFLSCPPYFFPLNSHGSEKILGILQFQIILSRSTLVYISDKRLATFAIESGEWLWHILVAFDISNRGRSLLETSESQLLQSMGEYLAVPGWYCKKYYKTVTSRGKQNILWLVQR